MSGLVPEKSIDQGCLDVETSHQDNLNIAEDVVDELATLAQKDGGIYQKNNASLVVTQKSLKAIFSGNAVPLGMTLLSMVLALLIIITKGFEPRQAYVPMGALSLTGLCMVILSSKKD